MDIETAQQTGVVFGIFILAVAFIWLLWAISPKLLGIVFAAFGAFIVVKLPGISKYERGPMTSAIISIGIILIIVGIFLIAFV